jgi:hypothetical protein
LPTSEAYLEDAPHDDLSFPVYLNGDLVGSIDFVAYDNLGTFTWSGDLQGMPGDRIRILRPDTLDTTAADLTVTFAATVGSVS